MVDTAIKNGINRRTYNSRVQRGWDKRLAATKPAATEYQGDYAIYKKGELVLMGSKKECAEYLGVTEQYIHWMTTPTGIKRRDERKKPEMAMAAVKLDD
ncbi:hypothetical protein ACXYMX_00305 [Sporosarcina sp. CAU 1771]